MSCKLCLEDKPTIRCHIIPKSFHKTLGNDFNLSRVVSNAKGKFPRAIPTGVFDKNIVCEQCERIFSPWDTYAQELLIKRLSEQEPICDQGELLAYKAPAFDYHKFKLFFLSVLWRASVSAQDYYSKVDLGPHEPAIQQMIRNNDPGHSDKYAVVLTKFDNPKAKIMLNPHNTKMNGINYCKMYLYGYVASIKIDQRVTPEPNDCVILKPDQPLIVIARNLSKSKELRVIKSLLRST